VPNLNKPNTKTKAISEAKKQNKICETRDGKEKTERKMF